MFGLAGAIAGIILIIIGILFVFFMLAPSKGGLTTYQPQEFSISFIVIGLVFIIMGALLLFVGW
jgi:integral membrane sensor domain MASE1